MHYSAISSWTASQSAGRVVQLSERRYASVMSVLTESKKNAGKMAQKTQVHMLINVKTRQ